MLFVYSGVFLKSSFGEDKYIDVNPLKDENSETSRQKWRGPNSSERR